MSPSWDRKKSRTKGVFLGLLIIFLAFHGSALTQPIPPPKGDSALYKEGETLLATGDVERALWRFKRLISDYPRSPLLNEAKFQMAVCYTRLKRHREAIQTLQALLSTLPSPSRMIQGLTLLGDNHLELREWLHALRWYGKGLLIPEQPHEELKKKIRSLIDSLDAEEELNQVESAYRGAYAGGYAKLRLAQMAKKMGYDFIARKMFVELAKEYSGMDYVSQSKEFFESISIPPRSKYQVGVVLPLIGIYKPFGERALDGIRLALKEKESKGKTPLISLIIRDSKGNALEAEKAIEELVKDQKVIAIIGPLLSNIVDRASNKSQQLKVPLLSLSQKEPLTKGDFLFQNSLTPADQVQGLVTFAIKELELRTFAIFYPNSPYGLHFKNLFSREVIRMGGRVLGTVVYQEEQTDFRQEIKGFFRVEVLPKLDGIKKKEEEFKQRLSVDGLFIPDTHDRVGTILTQMAFFDIKGTTFLGTSAWNGPGLISIGGRAAEGTFFVDAFSREDPRVRPFVDQFQKEYKRTPETLEAICYDGAIFLREILEAKSPSSPSELKEELRKFHPFQGVSGLRGFGEDGKAIRTLSILRVKNGRIEHFSP